MALNEKPSLETETGDDAGAAQAPESGPTPEWIQGGRLAAIALSQALSLFMVQAESSITSTAITSITNSLGGFERSSWVFTAYLLTYGAVPILLSKVSDILGRKQVLLGCLVLFVAFSGACVPAAANFWASIMFRWVKGIGSGGIVAISLGYGFELRPPDKWPSHTAFLSITGAVSLAISPLIGSSLAKVGAWRWCFLINVVIGVLTILVMYSAMPAKLHLEPAAQWTGQGGWRGRWLRLRRIDYLGSSMLVGASVLLTAACQEAASAASFASAKVLVLLILAPFFFLFFAIWQWRISKSDANREPAMSWSLLTNRVFMVGLCNAWLSGMVLTTTVVLIPQRFMLVNDLTPISAGVRLVPFTAVMTSTSVLVAIVLTKTATPAVYALMVGALLEIAGASGLCRSPVDGDVEASQYGFQVLVGAGVGIFNVVLLSLTPRVVAKKDLAAGNGAVNQFRILGGAHGLAIVTCATHPSLRANLLKILSLEQMELVLERTDQISSLTPVVQKLVREEFGNMYNLQMTILIGIAAAQLVATALQWTRNPVTLKDQDEKK